MILPCARATSLASVDFLSWAGRVHGTVGVYHARSLPSQGRPVEYLLVRFDACMKASEDTIRLQAQVIARLRARLAEAEAELARRDREMGRVTVLTLHRIDIRRCVGATGTIGCAG
jgi:hypothetical protein